MIDKSTANKLKAAGVSSDVILSLLLEEDEAPEEQPAPAVPEQQPEQAKYKLPVDKLPGVKEAAPVDPVLAAIEKLTGAIQASNILRDSTGTPKTETVEDILANMIAPQKEKGV